MQSGPREIYPEIRVQPFQGNIRYFILLGDLPQNRQVGYIAIGAAAISVGATAGRQR